MTDSATIQTRIDEIDAILADGVNESRQADRSTKWDLEALRKERSHLQGILNTRSRGGGMRRVVFKT